MIILNGGVWLPVVAIMAIFFIHTFLYQYISGDILSMFEY